jgi:hypothetical protein
MTKQEEQMKDISASRKTCAVVLAAVSLTLGGLAHAEESGRDEGKRTLSPESTHGTEKSLGSSKRGTSGSGTSQDSGNKSAPQGGAIGGSSTEKFSNTDIGGGGTGSGAVLQGGVTTNKQGTSGGADSMGGMRSGAGQGAGQGTGQGARSKSGTGGSGGSGSSSGR